MNEKFSAFVESMYRLLKNGMVQPDYIKGLLDAGTITKKEYEYIMDGKGV